MLNSLSGVYVSLGLQEQRGSDISELDMLAVLRADLKEQLQLLSDKTVIGAKLESLGRALLEVSGTVTFRYLISKVLAVLLFHNSPLSVLIIVIETYIDLTDILLYDCLK